MRRSEITGFTGVWTDGIWEWIIENIDNRNNKGSGVLEKKKELKNLKYCFVSHGHKLQHGNLVRGVDVKKSIKQRLINCKRKVKIYQRKTKMWLTCEKWHIACVDCSKYLPQVGGKKWKLIPTDIFNM